jgi:hypothetical protein
MKMFYFDWLINVYYLKKNICLILATGRELYPFETISRGYTPLYFGNIYLP